MRIADSTLILLHSNLYYLDENDGGEILLEDFVATIFVQFYSKRNCEVHELFKARQMNH